MTKIPLEILHFCETTNSGHDGNMSFLVLQVDGLLEGPSLIHIRLLQITSYRSSCSSSWFCLAPRSTVLYFAFPPTEVVHPRLCHPKLPGPCTTRSSFALVSSKTPSHLFPCDEVQKTKYLFFEGDLRPQHSLRSRLCSAWDSVVTQRLMT